MYTSSMMSRKMILPILAGLLVPWVVNMYHFLGFSTQLVYNDENCVLVNPTGLIGSEDLTIGRPRGSSRGNNEDGKEDTILFITQGDLKNVFHNNGQAAEGHIWTMRVDAREPQIAPVVGFPDTTLFQPHGCYVSNNNDLLYVINHVGTYSAVEVFSIQYHYRRRTDDDRNHRPPTLTYVHSIRDDDHFPVHGINDVVEGASRGEIYVTIWLPFGIFVSADITMFLQSVLAFVFRVRLTRVLRCTWGLSSSSSSQCQDATGHRQHRFFMANGITTNDDRSRIFVNDVLDKKIVVFSRSSEGSGSLVVESDIVLPFAGDNVEYDSETGALHIGSIPLLHSPKEGGMMVAITKEEEEEEEEELSIILSPPQWSVTHQVVHDGQKLTQISSAILFGDRVIMGSPNSHGILICGN